MTSEISDMIVPKRIRPVNITAECTKIVGFRFKEDSLIERIEAAGKKAIIFHKFTDILVKKYETDFEIINAFFVTFTPKTPEDYLCLIGVSQIDFYSLPENHYCSLALPFKICKAHLFNSGILLERNCYSEVDISPPDATQLFSLTHPYNEIFPVLYKFKDEHRCQYAFRNRRISVVQKNWNFNFSSELIMAYELESRKNHVFLIRKCSKEERMAAKSDLPLNASFNSPNSLQSFYSPNFFNRRFGPDQRIITSSAPVCQKQAPDSLESSLIETLEANRSTNMTNTGSRITPIRRTMRTRSMAAAVHKENLALANSLTATSSFASSIDKLSSQNHTHKSLERRLLQDATLNRMRQHQQQQQLLGGGGQNVAYSTPTRVIPLDTDDLLSFGGYGDEPANSLDMAVEFCLEWLWSEPPTVVPEQPTVSNPSVTAMEVVATSPATGEVFAEDATDQQIPRTGSAMVLSKMEQLRVSSTSTSMSSCSATDGNRQASTFFTTSDKFGQRFAVFHVDVDRCTRVLRVASTNTQDFGISIVEQPTVIRAFSTIPLLHSTFFAILECPASLSVASIDCPISPSCPLISLYSGALKVANIVMNIATITDNSKFLTLTRIQGLLPAGPSEFLLKIFDDQVKGTDRTLICELNLGPVTSLAEKCLHSVSECLGRERQMQFFSRYLCTNPWQVVEGAHKVLGYGQMPRAQIELALLFQYFFAEMGLDISELNIMQSVKHIRRWLNDGEETGESSSKRTRIDLGEDEEDMSWERFEADILAQKNAAEKPYESSEDKLAVKVAPSGRSDDLPEKYVFSLFGILHNFYESMKIDIRFHSLLPFFVEPLFVFAWVYKLDQYLNHYQKDYPKFARMEIHVDRDLAPKTPSNTKSFTTFRVPSIMGAVDQLINGTFSGTLLPNFLQLSDLCPVRILFCLGVSLNYFHTLSQLQRLLGKNWPKRLQLDDENTEKRLLSLLSKDSVSPKKKCAECMGLFGVSKERLKFLHPRLSEAFHGILEGEAEERANASLTTPEVQQRLLKPMRWTADIREHNVAQMLDSSLPVLIPVKALPSTSETQLREQQEQFLVVTALRTFTRPFGQALLNFRTKPRPVDESPLLLVKPICLNGRVNPGRLQIDFPLTDANSCHKLAMDWANFYNGLAYGLSVQGFGTGSDLEIPTRTSDLDQPACVQAGLLLAAGLTGNFRQHINLYDLHTFLTKNDRFLVIALLLGSAVAHRGTSDVHINKILATHLPFLLQPTLCEFRIESAIQTAALISLGLLFTETANHAVVHQLINQMSLEVFEGDQCAERYSFVLAAGFAVGLINLGKGREIEDTEIPIAYPHLSPKERLIKLLHGGERRLAFVSYDQLKCPAMRAAATVPASSATHHQMPRRYTPGAGGSAAAGGNLGTVGDGAGGGRTGNGPDISMDDTGAVGGGAPTHCNTNADFSGIGQPHSNHVRELPTVNIHLTSPAACVALTLMYLRTGDKWISDTLAIPNTFSGVDKIRPDVLMLRTLGRCLVDYDQIGKTTDWIQSQIPEIVRKYAQRFTAQSSPTAANKDGIWWTDFVCMQTVAQTYFYCSAGACLAMAIRYASSWDTQALRTIQDFFESVWAENSGRSEGFAKLAQKAGRNCMGACVNVSAICFGLIMAGSGDLQMIRILRMIRNFKPRFMPSNRDSAVHSSHTFANMALGLLFLGQGRLSLGKSNIAIASMLIAFFPLFPHSITDNRVYFQPMRFLWTLAL